VRPPAGRVEWLALTCQAACGVYLALLLLDTDVPLGLRLVRIALALAVTGVAMRLILSRPAGGRPRTGSWVAGFLSTVLGTIALAGGIVGLAHLAVEGLSPIGLAGLGAFGAGLVATVAGVAWLLRPLPRLWRLLGVPGGLAAAQFWLLPAFAAILSTHAPHVPMRAASPAGAESVNFAAEDRTALAGWYTRSMNGATVIVLAGAGGTRADVSGQAEVLTRNGFGVLALDSRGSGESGGHGMLYGWGGERDLSAAVAYLTSRGDVDARRIGVLGLSMGGEIAITGAALDTRVRAVVAEGATARVCADQTFLSTDYEGAIHHFDSCLGWAIASLMTAAPQPSPLVDEVRLLGSRPLLLIAADRPDERAATSALQAISPTTVQLWQPAGASHTGALAADPQEWEARVVGFLEEALLGT
jgi:hypothetical protein